MKVMHETRLLVVHQTKCMLKRYGNSICFLNATYKHSLPLFLVVVKTSENYQVIASFVVQDETTAITEALRITEG